MQTSVPRPLEPGRWPGLRSAISWANQVAKEHPPRPANEERYLWLRDLGVLSADLKSQERIVRIENYEKQLTMFHPDWREGFGHPSRYFRIKPDGTLERDFQTWMGWTDEVSKEVTSILEKHFREMRILRRILGMEDATVNPTVPGRTWLCTWPVVEGSVFSVEAALVVAGPGEVLMAGATLLLASAWDLEAEDRDLFATRLEGSSLLVNEVQRCGWGPSLHQINRVYWSVLPGGGEERRKRPTRKKKRPEPPEE